MVQALTRLLDLKTKELRARFGDGDDLPSVAEVHTFIATRMTAAIRRHVDEFRERFRVRAARLDRDRDEMTGLHRAARDTLDARHAEQWRAETLTRAARQPRGLRALWLRITGRYRTMRAQDETDAHATQRRHAAEQQGLIETQHEARAVLQSGIKALRAQYADELRGLREDIGRYLAPGPGGKPDAPSGTSSATTENKP